MSKRHRHAAPSTPLPVAPAKPLDPRDAALLGLAEEKAVALEERAKAAASQAAAWAGEEQKLVAAAASVRAEARALVAGKPPATAPAS